jgi:hypothetical protein
MWAHSPIDWKPHCTPAVHGRVRAAARHIYAAAHDPVIIKFHTGR